MPTTRADQHADSSVPIRDDGLNAKATWKRRADSLKAEPAAKWAMQLAVLASLGTMAAWCLLLLASGSAGDVRRMPLFWVLVAVFGIWAAPVQVYARWTMLTLRWFLALWVVLAAAALALNHVRAASDPAGTPLDPAWMWGVLAYTAVLSGAAFAALRRSSLPGGTGIAMEPGDRRAALPPPDARLRSAQLWFTVPLLANIVSCIIAGVAVMTGYPAETSPIGLVLSLAIGLITAQIVLLCWGQVQGRRTPSRRPHAWVALATMQAVVSAGLTVALIALGAAQARFGVVAAGIALGSGAAITAACLAMVFKRLRGRARGYDFG